MGQWGSESGGPGKKEKLFVSEFTWLNQIMGLFLITLDMWQCGDGGREST